MPRRAIVALGALCLASSACGGPRADGAAAAGAGAGSAAPAAASAAGQMPASRVGHHLLRDFEIAELDREVALFELGTAAARDHLLRGWGVDEHDGERPFVWGLGEASELEFFAAAPRPLTIVLHGRSPGFEGDGPQGVAVTLNGEKLATVELGDHFGKHRLPAPATALRRGRNRLRFDYRFQSPPRDAMAGSRDVRPLAAQWYSVELRGLGSAGPPRLAEDAERLEIPSGSRVSYYLELEPGSELVIGELRGWGNGPPRLLVELETRDVRRDGTFDPGAAEAPLRFPLEIDEPAIGRLSLTAFRARQAAAGWRDRLRGWLGSAPDEGGLSVLLPMVMAAGAPPAEEAETGGEDGGWRVPRPPDVLIYLIDTLRADHLGVYGYQRPTSPRIDRFARDGIVFRNAQAQSSWTRSSVVSLMTGLLPQAHGVNRRDDALSRSVETLAEILGRSGYESAAFVTNGNVAASFGLAQGFEKYEYFPESSRRFRVHVLADALNRHLFRWLEELDDRRRRPPFFLYIHATDPHAPYTPPKPFRQRFAAGVDPEVGGLDSFHQVASGRRDAPAGLEDDLIDLYDGEIAFTDHHFGRLLDRLQALGLYDGSLIVLLSDHGEEFLDHGRWEHGKTLYGEQLRVPLIVKLPGGAFAGTEVGELADQVDVLPTLLDVLGLDEPGVRDGRSLMPLVRGGRRDRPSHAYLLLEKMRLRSIVAEGFKLILDDSEFRRRSVELYRVAGDPLETRDLLPGRDLERGFLLQKLRAFELDLRRGSRQSTAEPAEIDAELRERLEALGYVQ